MTFDDVLLVPAESRVLPNDVSTSTRLTPSIPRHPAGVTAMDTVTEARLAIALAREGGMGIVHRNLSIEDQVAEVDKVKQSESGMIVEPVTLASRRARVGCARADGALPHQRRPDHGRPGDRLVGILTNRDLRFENDTAQPVSALMTARNLVTAPVGTTLDEAEEILHRNKIEKLPVVDADGLKGLITVKDIQKKIQYPHATKDERGRLRVGAAVGVGSDALERAEALVDADADVLVVDTAHGHSAGVIEMVREDQGATLRRADRRQRRDRARRRRR